MCELLVAVTFLVAELGLWGALPSVIGALRLATTGSTVVAHRLSWPGACGIFSDQGSNPCFLHWQVDPSPLSLRKPPKIIFSTKLSNCLYFVIYNVTFSLAIRTMHSHHRICRLTRRRLFITLASQKPPSSKVKTCLNIPIIIFTQKISDQFTWPPSHVYTMNASRVTLKF